MMFYKPATVDMPKRLCVIKMRTKIKTYCYYFLTLFLISCAGSSELITRSSRNLHTGESEITGAFSLNPTIMPLNDRDIDTINNTSIRDYGNYPNPMNPIISGQYNYGVCDFYETGLGIDFSSIGYSIFLNNKIGFSDISNSQEHKRIGLSYYNKSSFTQGFASFGGSYLPYKKGHIEIGNYLIFGVFLKESELIISPHVDFNLLMSKKYESYYIIDGNAYEFSPAPEDESRRTRIVNNNLSFINYGLNIAYKTKNNWFFEIGMQYIDLDYDFYEPIRKSNYQYYFGIGVSLDYSLL